LIVFSGYSGFSTTKTDIVESGVKHHNGSPNPFLKTKNIDVNVGQRRQAKHYVKFFLMLNAEAAFTGKTLIVLTREN
jgi:hypothetical protein